MQTDDLIVALARDLAPVPAGTVRRRIMLGIAAGAILPLVLVLLALGLRPDLSLAMQDFPFWVKLAYTLTLGAIALLASLRLCRPEVSRLPALWPLLSIPFAALIFFAAREWSRAPAGSWIGLWLGRSEFKCMALIVLLSIPFFAGLVWTFQRLAPGNIRLAGAMAGLASGACAATLYGLHCTESAMAFVLVWYTVGMGLAALGGSLAASKFLRW